MWVVKLAHKLLTLMFDHVCIACHVGYIRLIVVFSLQQTLVTFIGGP